MPLEFVARNGLISQGNLVVSGSITSTGTVTISGSIASASFASTASSADNFLARGTITAQTLVVQTITSSVDFVTGSTRFGSNVAVSTHQFTGSVGITGSLSVATTGTELQVNANGVNIGNALTDIHIVSGSLRIAGPVTSSGALSGTSATFSSSVAATSLALNGSIANSGDAATLTIKQSSTTFTNGIYLERGGERNGYYMYIGNSLDSLTFRRNYFGTQSDVMSLTRDGNVGIGTASPGYKLDVYSSATSGAPLLANFQSAGGDTQVYVSNSTITTQLTADNTNGVSIVGSLSNHPLVIRTNNTERMRITSGGNVQIGTVSSSDSLTISKSTYPQIRLVETTTSPNATAIFGYDSPSAEWRIRSVTNHPLTFGTNDTERMRITSGGWTKASTNGSYRTGATGAGHEFADNDTSAINHFTIHNSSASTAGQLLRIVGDRTTTNGTFQLIQASNGNDSGRFLVLDSGNCQNTNNSYGAISDIKLKENITDASPKLDDILKVKIKNFNFIGDDRKQIGVIAQELEEIFPSMIDETIDKDSEGNELGTTTKAVKYSVFVPMLIKAIQELKAQNDSLQSQINELKAQ